MAKDKWAERAPAPGKLRALRDWLIGAPTPSPARDVSHGDSGMPERIGRYQVLRKLGQGGMGVVYAARDERLQRTLAIKTIGALIGDEAARKRFWREARAAAAVNHPNICSIYELVEEGDQPFIVMELLEGEPLSVRLARGSLPIAEAVEIGVAALSALTALHDRGLVHRDLKPSNVFLTPHGVKLLDFGLARITDQASADSLAPRSELTNAGAIVGTPRYMAPEQVLGEVVDARADLFAAGSILFEMLAGRPAFAGRNLVEVLHSTLHDQPPALTGSPAIVAVDRVIRRALAKAPRDRPATAQAMAGELRAALQASGHEAAAVARALKRLVVLPFRPLRPDADTDFLGFSLPDAISTSLSGLGSLVLRSSATAARFAGESPDLKGIASEADVDLVVMGTLLRVGDQLRVTTQLVETPSGTLVASHTLQSPLGDLFSLQDDLARRLVEALALPLAGREDVASRDVPASARAYEFYLRANEVARRYDQFPVARDLYLRCLDEDPRFAPAWARLGRCYWLIGKYNLDAPRENRVRAKAALERALELNPDLSLAHKFYAHLESELGRAPDAMARLLRHAYAHRNDPELFAGLVHACRYCGLLEASVAAHREARRLDPHVATSLPFTLLWKGDSEQLASEHGTIVDSEALLLSVAWSGRREEALAILARFDIPKAMAGFKAYVEGRSADAIAALERGLGSQEDPEAHFILGCTLARLGEPQRALVAISRAVRGGLFLVTTLARDPGLEALRSEPAFAELQRHAAHGRAAALTAFREAGGDSLLGVDAR